jgi:hypothetical protein
MPLTRHNAASGQPSLRKRHLNIEVHSEAVLFAVIFASLNHFGAIE